MGDQKPGKPSAAQVKDAESLWSGFVEAGKWGIIGTAIVLILMLIFLV